MSDCLFCKIIRGEIPSEKVYEDERVFAFRDISPQAPVHVLIVPKKHIDSALLLDESDGDLVTYIFRVASKIAKDEGVSESGFRIVNNIGEDGGQTVKHLHFHVLGGRNLGWPPG